jgi:hypothetical protein
VGAAAAGGCEDRVAPDRVVPARGVHRYEPASARPPSRDAPRPLRTGRTGPVRPPEPGQEPEKRAPGRARRCTLARRTPAAESGKVVWETSVESGRLLRYYAILPFRLRRALGQKRNVGLDAYRGAELGK